jgi:RNA polymerase sigma-70 factor (ECF subfamily)
MAMEKTDVAIIRSVLAGNKGEYRVLLDRHLKAVYAFAYRYVRNPHDAEDIAQEAFVRAWKNLKKFDQSRNFKTWLFAIAKNAALDLIKKKKPMPFSQISEESEKLDALLAPYIGVEELPSAAFERTVVKAALANKLGTLPPAYRTVLAMRYHDNLKFREIAEALGEPIDTVKSKHRRGLALLRNVVSGDPSLSDFA